MLVECPECKQQISDQAESCPHCGLPIKSSVQKIRPAAQRKSHAGRSGCLITLGVLAVLGLIGSLLPKIQQSSSDAPENYGPSYIEWLREAEPKELTEGITPEQYKEAAALIRSNGYDCPTANLMERYAFSDGFTAYCKGGRYKSYLTNHGGKWSVTAP